jgi:predicted nucleotidyltransferase
MNIHIDISTKNILDNHIISDTVFGSKLYGCDNSSSDTDMMMIYQPSFEEKNSIFVSHHQMQYKDISTNTDYIYSNISQFIRNTINGDATINAEIIFSDSFKNTSLEFLHNNRHIFVNYRLIKCYLGICRRDLREASKTDNPSKKVAHAYRGYVFAKQLMEDPDNFKNIFDISFYNIIKNMNYKEISKYSSELLNDINILREYLNKTTILPKTMKPSDMKLLDEFIFEITKYPSWNMDYSNQYYYIENIIEY